MFCSKTNQQAAREGAIVQNKGLKRLAFDVRTLPLKSILQR